MLFFLLGNNTDQESDILSETFLYILNGREYLPTLHTAPWLGKELLLAVGYVDCMIIP